MISSAMQLKVKIRNMSGGDGVKAQTLLRNYMMERFIERCAVSKYRNHFILKGGMFLASYVGLDTRATMDIDTTVQALPLTLDIVSKVIQEIIDVPLEDGVTFQIISAKNIMEEHEYPGICFMLDGFFDRIKQPIKIAISTGDVIIPKAIEYSYPLMFEDRTIDILAYNLETVLGEKLETILSRAEANTRMRDFYDIYILLSEKHREIRQNILQEAFAAICMKRNSSEIIADAEEILSAVKDSAALEKQWNNYRAGSYYVGELKWQEVNAGVYELAQMLQLV